MTKIKVKLSTMDGFVLMPLVYGIGLNYDYGCNYHHLKNRHTAGFTLRVENSYNAMCYGNDNGVEIPLFMFLSLAEQISKSTPR